MSPKEVKSFVRQLLGEGSLMRVMWLRKEGHLLNRLVALSLWKN